MKRSAILLALLLCILYVWGQNNLSEYSFSYSVSPYVEITDGTLLGNATTDGHFFVDPIAIGGGTTTKTGVGFPIGFVFVFAGHSFDMVGISANGWISLGNSSFGQDAVNMKSTNNSTPLASLINITPDEVLVARIAGFARDLQAQTGSSIRIEQQGEAPYRELIVQWKHYRRRNATGESLNFQICLKEQGMQVITSYQLMQANLCAGQIGLRAAPAATATNFANRTTADGWASSVAGTAANNGATLSSAIFPEPGATFTWTPVMAVPGPSISIQMQGNNAVISWDPVDLDENGNGFTPEYYDLYSNSCSTDSEDFSFLARISYPLTSYTHESVGLGASRMMYRVKAVRD